MGRETFVCPFCGAPQGYELQPGTIQVKCRYCGGMILVPSELGGLYQQCPNHPGVASIGLCNRCGRGFCEQCLHVMPYGITNLYYCHQCMEQWKSDLFSDLFYTYPCGLVVTVFGLMVFLVGLATKQIAIAALGGLSIFFGLCSWAGSRIKSHPPPFPPTVQEKRKASKELLGVTQTVCPHCNAAYFYGSDRITRDGTVICQNCNQPIDLRSVSHET